ncbi:MAG: Vibrio phage [Pseudomonadota bacterium]
MKFPRLSTFSSWLGLSAATDMPDPVDPKVKRGQRVLPSYLTTSKPSTKSALPRNERNLINTDITTYRTGSTARQTIRDFVKASPDLSGAVTSYVRLAVTRGYTAIAKNRDGTINPDATRALAQMLASFDVLNDYSLGYDDSPSIRSLAETWSREILIEGAMAGELVLDKALLPYKIQPVNVGQIRLYPSSDGKRLIPQQELAGETISLDTPTFFMVSLDQDTVITYPESPLEPALQPTLAAAEFLNDIRRVVKKSIHPRMVVSIDEEKFRKSMPQDVLQDQEKMIAYKNQVINEIQSQVNDMAPEEALVLFDSITVKIEDHGNTNLNNEYEVIQGMYDARMATGAKVMPTVLGKANGTSNVASSEVVMFVKYVEGAVQSKLHEMFSKMLTLGVRLLGHDVFVTFEFNPIELRPESELESFRSMKQSRILDLLSLGMLSDEEACIQLTGQLPSANYKPLSGTGFRATAKVDPAGNGYNGASNDGSTMNQNLKPDTPTGVKGGQKQASVVPLR